MNQQPALLSFPPNQADEVICSLRVGGLTLSRESSGFTPSHPNKELQKSSTRDKEYLNAREVGSVNRDKSDPATQRHGVATSECIFLHVVKPFRLLRGDLGGRDMNQPTNAQGPIFAFPPYHANVTVWKPDCSFLAPVRPLEVAE